MSFKIAAQVINKRPSSASTNIQFMYIQILSFIPAPYIRLSKKGYRIASLYDNRLYSKRQ